MTRRSVEPWEVRFCGAEVNRVFYIDIHRENVRNASNIRKKLSEKLSDLDWNNSDNHTSFLFYKRNDSTSFDPEAEAQQAIKGTRLLYPNANFEFHMLLKPFSDAANVEV